MQQILPTNLPSLITFIASFSALTESWTRGQVAQKGAKDAIWSPSLFSTLRWVWIWPFPIDTMTDLHGHPHKMVSPSPITQIGNHKLRPEHHTRFERSVITYPSWPVILLAMRPWSISRHSSNAASPLPNIHLSIHGLECASSSSWLIVPQGCSSGQNCHQLFATRSSTWALDVTLAGAFCEEGDMIDQLYKQTLQYSFQNTKLLDWFKRVIGVIVLAKTLLHRDRLKHFLGKQEDELSIDFILLKLSSVISTWTTDRQIQINHLSFTDFVCDPNWGNEFAIDYMTHTQIMMLACLKIMKEHLQFNISCIVLLGEVVGDATWAASDM